MWTPDHPHQNPPQGICYKHCCLGSTPYLLTQISWSYTQESTSTSECIDTHWFKPVGLRWGQLGQALAMSGDILIHQICWYWHPTVHRTAPCSKEQYSSNGQGMLRERKPEFNLNGFLWGLLFLHSYIFPLSPLLSPHLAHLQVAKFSEWTDTHIGTHCQLHIGERNVGRTIADSLKNAFSSIPELNCKAGLHKPSQRLEALAELEQIIQIQRGINDSSCQCA